jgi:hypothetical protein
MDPHVRPHHEDRDQTHTTVVARAASSVTRRSVVSGAAAGALAVALGLGNRRVLGAAQEYTPLTAPTGVAIQMMGVGQPSTTPGMELTLRRTTIAPGGGLPPHSHPGALVIVVESGTWGYTALGGGVQLTRAAVAGTPSPAEAMEFGAQVTLTAGDALFVEDPEDDFRNVGDDDVVLLVAGLTPVGEPFTTLMDAMDMEGTPTS